MKSRRRCRAQLPVERICPALPLHLYEPRAPLRSREDSHAGEGDILGLRLTYRGVHGAGGVGGRLGIFEGEVGPEQALGLAVDVGRQVIPKGADGREGRDAQHDRRDKEQQSAAVAATVAPCHSE